MSTTVFNIAKKKYSPNDLAAAAVDNGNDRATATTATTSWTAINGGNITQFLVYVHTGSNDAANIPVMIVDDASGLPLTTNGSDVNLAAQVIRYA